MAQIRLRIVGESVIEVGRKRITPTAPQLFALLLYLGTERDREIPRAALIHLLYPAEDPIGDSSHRLRQSLYKLRTLGAPLVFGEGTVSLEARQVRSDVSDLLDGGWEARRERLDRSFEVLPHYAPPTDAPLSAWVEQLREQLHNALRQHLTRDLEIARRKADWRSLEVIARRTSELDPLNESAVLALAEATARTGSKARAVSILDAYRTELGEDRATLALPASLLQKRIDASRDRVPSARREPVPLIGRERELESLLSQWQSARRGNAHLLWLTGNKSIGKSRLAEELATSVLMSGSGQVVRFALSPMDVDRPLSLIAALANRLSSLPGAAGCDPQSLRAMGKLSGSIAIPSAVNPENINSAYSETGIRNAICDLAGCVTDERPVLAIIDDAQHLDGASEQLLNSVLRRVSDKRFLIVMCGAHERVSDQHRCSAVHLEPLSTEASERLWQAMLSAQELRLSEAFSRKCLDTAAGNPGHMELLAHQAARDPEQFLIPADLIALTDRRLSQLPASARYALEATVILDDVATTNSVAHLTGLATYDLLTAFHVLESNDLVVNNHTGLRCRSGLIVERVRATSSSTVASVMEGRAAEYLEKNQTGERWTPSMAWRIASHWQRAGEPRRARAYLRACWQHAVSIGQPASACAAIKQSLAVITDPEDRASLLDDLIGALQAVGDKAAIAQVVADRQSLSARVHDSAVRIAELAFDAEEAYWLKDLDPALHIDALRAHLHSPLLDPRRRLSAARMLVVAADLTLDAALAKQAVVGCDTISPDSVHSQLLKLHVSLIYHTIFGDRDRALEIADAIEASLHDTERSWYSLVSRRNCAFARQLAGCGPSDYGSLERGYAEAIDASMIAVALGFAAYLASLFVDDGDLARAQQWLATCERLADSSGDQDLPFDYLGAQIDLALLTGNIRKALQYVEVLETHWSRFESQRTRNEVRIYRLRVQQHLGRVDLTGAQLEELIRFHEVGRGFTRHDDHMEVLWTALNAAGESLRASELLSTYLLEFRRERRRARFFLWHRTQDDPAWRLVNSRTQSRHAQDA